MHLKNLIWKSLNFFLFKIKHNKINLLKNIDYSIFDELLKNLEKIENGEISQHDASVKVKNNY